MTISSEVSRSGPYNGNGVTTVFDYDFKIVNENHLTVIKRSAAGVESTLVIDTDYIVSDVGNPSGGQIACTSAPASGETITILRNVPFTQETDLENQGAYYAETVEAFFDLATMRDQQLQEQVDRAVRIPASADAETLDSLIEDIIRLGDSADNIDTVANNIGDVGTVADHIANVDTVAGVAASVSAVAAVDDEVVTVAGIAGNVTTVAGVAGNVSTVAGIAPAVSTVAGIDDDVSTVAGIASDVSTVADNLADVTNFADVYQGPKASDPATRNDGSALQDGDLYFNTASKQLKIYDGAAWHAVSDQALNIAVKSFTGDGAETDFTLDVSPGTVNNLFVEVGGILQVPTVDFTVSGSTLTFTSAPGNGVSIATWALATTATLNVPGDGTVTEDKLEASVAAKLLPVPATPFAVLRGKQDASGYDPDEGYRPVYMVEDQAGATTNDKLLFALDNAAKNGGVVIGARGLSAIVPSAIIVVPSRVALRGRGLRIAPNASRANVIKAEASGHDIEIGGLDIDCSGGSSTTAVIEAEGVEGIKIGGNRVKKFSAYGISVLSATGRAATDVEIEKNYLYDPAAGVIFPYIVRSVQGNVNWPKRVGIRFNRYFGSDPANPVAGDYLAGDRITPAGGAHCADCIVLQGCEDFDVYGNNVEYSGSAVVSITNGSYYGRVAHNSARIAYEGYNIGAGVMMVYCADISDFQVSATFNCSTAGVPNAKVLAKSPDLAGTGGWLWLNGISGNNLPAIGETITQATTGASDAIVDVRHGAFNVSVYGNEAIDCGARGPDTGAGVTTYGAYNWIGAQGVNRCTNNVYSNPLGVGQANRHTSNSKSKVLVGANRVGGRAARPWIDSSHTGDYVLSAAGTYGAWLGMDVAGGGVALAGRASAAISGGTITLSRTANVTSAIRSSAGVYVYTIPDMGLGDYYTVQVEFLGSGSKGSSSVAYTSATSFTVYTYDTSGTAADINHRITIAG